MKYTGPVRVRIEGAREDPRAQFLVAMGRRMLGRLDATQSANPRASAVADAWTDESGDSVLVVWTPFVKSCIVRIRPPESGAEKFPRPSSRRYESYGEVQMLVPATGIAIQGSKESRLGSDIQDEFVRIDGVPVDYHDMFKYVGSGDVSAVVKMSRRAPPDNVYKKRELVVPVHVNRQLPVAPLSLVTPPAYYDGGFIYYDNLKNSACFTHAPRRDQQTPAKEVNAGLLVTTEPYGTNEDGSSGAQADVAATWVMYIDGVRMYMHTNIRDVAPEADQGGTLGVDAFPSGGWGGYGWDGVAGQDYSAPPSLPDTLKFWLHTSTDYAGAKEEGYLAEVSASRLGIDTTSNTYGWRLLDISDSGQSMLVESVAYLSGGSQGLITSARPGVHSAGIYRLDFDPNIKNGLVFSFDVRVTTVYTEDQMTTYERQSVDVVVFSPRDTRYWMLELVDKSSNLFRWREVTEAEYANKNDLHDEGLVKEAIVSEKVSNEIKVSLDERRVLTCYFDGEEVKTWTLRATQDSVGSGSASDGHSVSGDWSDGDEAEGDPPVNTMEASGSAHASYDVTVKMDVEISNGEGVTFSGGLDYRSTYSTTTNAVGFSDKDYVELRYQMSVGGSRKLEFRGDLVNLNGYPKPLEDVWQYNYDVTTETGEYFEYGPDDDLKLGRRSMIGLGSTATFSLPGRATANSDKFLETQSVLRPSLASEVLPWREFQAVADRLGSSKCIAISGYFVDRGFTGSESGGDRMFVGEDWCVRGPVLTPEGVIPASEMGDAFYVGERKWKATALTSDIEVTYDTLVNCGSYNPVTKQVAWGFENPVAWSGAWEPIDKNLVGPPYLVSPMSVDKQKTSPAQRETLFIDRLYFGSVPRAPEP